MVNSTLDLGTLAYTVTVNGADRAKRTMGELKEEIKSAESEGRQGFDNIGRGSDAAGKSMEALTAVAVAAAAAVAKLAAEAVQFADNWKGAMNDFQAQTGASAEEMAEFEQLAENIYVNNFGDSIDDIANSMANVRQQTGMTGEELERTTQNALMLRDTFGWDVQESVRAVDMMMKQFGITSDEAYTLLAQGAQQGLDKNDNLLDTLNEYSPYFSQLGFNAEQTFDMLSAGAEAGAFDIDKLGDAMKEFNIRVKDGSDSTKGAFESLGLEADVMQAQFAAGGEQAQQAFALVVDALGKTDDAVLKNTAGVALFGTMWEDLEVATVSAMLNANAAFDVTADTLQEIEAVKYDTIGDAMRGIGRNLEASILKPIGESLLPLFQSLADWVARNMPKIQRTIETVLKAIGTAVDILVALLTGDIDKIDNYLTMAVEAIKSLLSQAMSYIGDLVQTAAHNIVNSVRQLAYNMVQALSDLPSRAMEIGRQFIQGLINGVGSMASSLMNACRNMASNALESIKQKFDINSPSGVMEEYGQYIGEGLALGIKESNSLVSDAMSKLAGKAQATIGVSASGTLTAVRQNVAANTMTATTAAVSAVKHGSGNAQPVFNIQATIREDADIYKITQEIDRMLRRTSRGRGVVV